MKNIDKIKSLNLEGMATFIHEVSSQERCYATHECNSICACKDYKYCWLTIKEWLLKECKEKDDLHNI